jgi:hypothetical protein
MKALTSNEILGLAAAVLGIALLALVIPAGIDLSEIEAKTGVLVRPDFWPIMVAAILTVAGLGYFVASRFVAASDVSHSAPRFARFNLKGALAIFAVVALLLLADTTIGLLIPAILMFAITSFSYGPEQRWLKIVLAIAIPCALVGFFEFVANIDVPVGSLVGKVIGR